ncbi:MAG: hypothetical protein QXK48_02030 [Candidatus Aenigmatarchaeota archaeon]
MEEKIKKLLEKVKKVTQEGKIDLSSDEDLSVAVMNLLSLEEHFFFTGAKTKKTKYFDLLNEIREMRKELMKRLVKKTEGESWCILKHLLAASMRLIEVGTKELNKGNKKEAEDLFSKAYQLYSLFWGINLNIVKIGEIKEIEDKKLNVHDKEGNVFSKLGAIVQKIVDCCKE